MVLERRSAANPIPTPALPLKGRGERRPRRQRSGLRVRFAYPGYEGYECVERRE